MSEQPPPRLLDDPSVDSLLRRDLTAARTHSAVPYDGAAGLERLRTNIDAGTTGLSGASTTGKIVATGSGHALKWWGISAAGLALLGAAWLVAPEGETSDPSPAPSADAPAAPVTESTTARTTDTDRDGRAAKGPEKAASALVSDQGQAQATSAPAPAPAAGGEQPDIPHMNDETGGAQRGARAQASTAGDKHERKAHRRASATRSKRVAEQRPRPSASDAADPDARKIREIRQLAKARGALDARPALTLYLARQGQHEFADGMFVQERDALIVFALDALGRRSEARTVAERFLRRYPEGPFSARVRRITEGTP